ncbi:MAG: penicillin-binding protein activator [Desulfuromonadales bacterium]|nr:penicillin-binding protein activator [Desulfuromonadales bacterium]
MKRILAPIIIGTLLLLCFSGTTVTATAVSELQQGQELFQAGKLNQSLAILRSFVRKTPSSVETAKASALIGRIFSQQHNYTDALLYLQRIPTTFRSPEIELLLGNSLVQTNNFAAGLQQLQPLLNESFDPGDETTLYQALTVAATETQQLLLALYYLQQQLPTSHNPAAIITQAHRLLQSRLSETDLEEAAFVWQQTAIGQDARLQLARRALVQQQNDLAKDHLQKLFASAVTFPYWHEAEQLLRRTSAENWLSRDSIGILLPLSGDYASYGELVKKGLELALQEHNKTRLPARFIYKDTATTAATSAQLVSSLSDDDKVMAVIGPLLGKTATEAARRAQLEMVPLLTMAQGKGLPAVGNFIFRNTLTAEQQVKTLIDHALASHHISFSILRPENRLGEKMTDLFVAQLQQTEGELLDIISYPEDSTDFKAQIERLLWEDRVVEIPEEEIATDEEGKDGTEEEPTKNRKPPVLDYPLPPSHALFIPDYADRISQIAPQLLFYGLKDVTLLGINGWNSPELASRTGRFLADAVFVDAFYPESSNPEVQRFLELYRQTYKEEPTILSAQAFEIATMLLQIIDDSEVDNRDDVRKKLAAIDHYRGITGTTGFDIHGEALKQLYLLQIKRGKIVELQ